MLIKPTGAKWWRFDYSIDGKRKTLSLGVCPATGLADARRKAEEARSKVANRIDPSETRKEAKAAKQAEVENQKRIDAGLPMLNSFEHVVREWLAPIEHTVTENTHYKKTRLFEMHAFPIIGRLGIGDIKSPCVFEIVKPLIETGKLESSRRMPMQSLTVSPITTRRKRSRNRYRRQRLNTGPHQEPARGLRETGQYLKRAATGE